MRDSTGESIRQSAEFIMLRIIPSKDIRILVSILDVWGKTQNVF